MHNRFKILDVNVSAVDLQRACEETDELIQQKRKGYVCVAPVATIMDCQDSDEYKDVINNADMVTPDGMPLVWLAHRAGHREVKRTYGPDFMLELCRYGQMKGYKHYLYGGTDEALDKLESILRERFSGINIVGKYSPPFRQISEEENSEMINKINEAEADVVWVGLGSPKQDFWMKQNRENLNASVLVGVGAAFDFLSGTKAQAPRWMQKSGLEWLFRLCSEPKRLWRRYLIGNTRFVYLVAKNYLTKRTA